MPFASSPQLRYLGAGQYVTTAPCEYVGSTQVFRIPADMPTDLASVPRAFWALMPPNGAYEIAAVVHDHFCYGLAKGTCEVSARDADAIARRIAREGGTGFLSRWIFWQGTRLGAIRNKARRPGLWRDMPLVLAITALELAVVVGVFAAVHLAIDAITGS